MSTKAQQIEFLKKDLSSPDASIRRRAANRLGEIGDKSVIPWLEDLFDLKNENKQAVRSAARLAVEKINKVQ